MSIAAIVLSVISMILGGVNLLFMVLICAALNRCLKAIEAAGLTSEEAQTIPAQLEKAVAFASVRQLHSATFKAFEISREPDGKGGWKDEPEGYSCFTAYGNRKVRIGTADNYRTYEIRP